MGYMGVIRLFAGIRFERYTLELLNLGKMDRQRDIEGESIKLKA
jgi:hypothetical protein